MIGLAETPGCLISDQNLTYGPIRQGKLGRCHGRQFIRQGQHGQCRQQQFILQGRQFIRQTNPGRCYRCRNIWICPQADCNRLQMNVSWRIRGNIPETIRTRPIHLWSVRRVFSWIDGHFISRPHLPGSVWTHLHRKSRLPPPPGCLQTKL